MTEAKEIQTWDCAGWRCPECRRIYQCEFHDDCEFIARDKCSCVTCAKLALNQENNNDLQ